jgi:hypothetical protein
MLILNKIFNEFYKIGFYNKNIYNSGLNLIRMCLHA